MDAIKQLQDDAQTQFAVFKNSPKDNSIKEVSSEIERSQARVDEVFDKAVQLFKDGKTAEALAIEQEQIADAGIRSVHGISQDQLHFN
ncbi:hypothetical protein ACTMU2_17605 [Cupriavidus basilensis]